ncbi:hypothetical protein SNEBB_002700 [Seison nebaliae]|nr:hypothetical protein SNEBB_002700 [Seison nebaliae]
MLMSKINDIDIYDLSSGRNIIDWFAEKRRNRKNKSTKEEIQLIQDFSMPNLSQQIELTEDGESIFVSGNYKPRIRCFDTKSMTQKFERCIDSDCVKFQILSDNYEKFVLLESDRYLEFHTTLGKHYKLRIPRQGTDLHYQKSTSNLYVCGQGEELWRLNLSKGKFLPPISTGMKNLNCISINPDHELITCGSDNGIVVCIDDRQSNPINLLDTQKHLEVSMEKGVSCIRHKNGMNLCVGLDNGKVLLYDIRMERPLLIKDHHYDMPIKQCHYYTSPTDEKYVLSLDEKILRIWDESTGTNLCNIESEAKLNDFQIYQNCGLIFMANDDERMKSFYIPKLGAAPSWCSFVDDVIDDLEKVEESIVTSNYKFVTREDLIELNLLHLIGTDLLRVYMHGYFLPLHIYKKALNITNPVQLEKIEKEKIQKKIEEERRERARMDEDVEIIEVIQDANDRIREQLNDVTNINVNKEYFMEKIYQTDEETINKSQRRQSTRRQQRIAEQVLIDDRFKNLFNDDDFQIDEECEAYRYTQHSDNYKPKYNDVHESSDDEDDDNRMSFQLKNSTNKKKKIETTIEEVVDDEAIGEKNKKLTMKERILRNDRSNDNDGSTVAND